MKLIEQFKHTLYLCDYKIISRTKEKNVTTFEIECGCDTPIKLNTTLDLEQEPANSYLIRGLMQCVRKAETAKYSK